MDRTTDVTISRDGRQLRVELDTAALADYPESVTIEGEEFGKGTRLALEAIEPMLRGEWAALLSFLYPQPVWVVVAIPRSDNVVALDARTDDGSDDAETLQSADRRLEHPPVPVAKRALVEELLRWAHDALEIDSSDHRCLDYDYARDAYDYYQEHGSLEGYEWVPNDETIHETLFGTGPKDERVLAYIDRHNRVEKLVREFVEGEEEDVERRLDRLLCHRDDRIATAALEALSEYDRVPSDVSKAMLQLVWSFDQHPERVRRVVPLFAAVDDDDHFEHVLDLTERSKQAAFRRTVAEGLGGVDDPRVRDTLETLRREDPDSDVRDAAADALERLDA